MVFLVAKNEEYVGGIIVVWMVNRSFQHINMKVEFENGKECHFTTIYASPNKDKIRVLWEDLEKISDKVNGAWMVAEDFNDIASSSEKKGEAQVSIRK